MSVLDLAKATLVCGSLGFVTYQFPIVSQTMTIAVLSVLWLIYARGTLKRLRRR